MADNILRVGDILYGFCGGEFGRDSYGDKRVEAIGSDWVIVRTEGYSKEYPDFYSGNPEVLCRYRTKDPYDE
jgi:hypothetical protein